MKFEKILFHTRFRELALNSFKSILELEKAGLKKVVLAHIIPREDFLVPYGGYMKDKEEELVELAKIRFEEWRQTVADHPTEIDFRVEVGSVNDKILEIAQKENVDLIVAGRKKRTLLEKIYVGSHILDLVRRSPKPVLLSKYMVQFEWEGESLTRTNDKVFSCPMLATDWSEPSENALDALLAMKGVTQRVIVAHNIDSKLTKNRSKTDIRGLEEESRKRLEKYCDTLKKNGLTAEPHLSFGHTATEIIRLSREHRATMIILGRTGKDWFQEYWFGGVSHRVAENSELPVMLVP